MEKDKFRVVRKNRYGHRWIEETEERSRFRVMCKHNHNGYCDKNCFCYVNDGGHPAILCGCTPDVDCTRMKRWDRKHGLERPYTMVYNEKEVRRWKEIMKKVAEL